MTKYKQVVKKINSKMVQRISTTVESRKKSIMWLTIVLLFIASFMISSSANAVIMTHSNLKLISVQPQLVSANQVRITVNFSANINHPPQVFTTQNPTRIVLDFPGTTNQLNPNQQNFNLGMLTNLVAIEAEDRTRLVLNLSEPVDYNATLEGKAFIINLHTKQVKSKLITLNFQDVKVRAALQLIAEFTGINIVVSDAVQGDMTIHLHDVPWDEALKIILTTQNLGKEQIGNVILIAPATEIAAREKQKMQALQQVQELQPLQAELIQINYAKASKIAALLKDNALLSDRGTVGVDARTNTLWVQDTPEKLNEVHKFITRLDVPIRQVLIESRIVNMDKTYEQDLGVRWGVTNPNIISGTGEAANQLQNGTPAAAIPFNQRLNVNLPATDLTGQGIPGTPATLGIALAKIGSNTFLDLELSALEVEGHAKIISSPRLITSNQQPAFIQQGEEIPYQQSTSSGATAVEFKDAVLSLKVTPQITPDNKVILQIQVNQDQPKGIPTLGSIPSIDTREIRTQVLVDNGETLVLGGIYEQTNQKTVKRVPFFGSLPIVGILFRSTQVQNERKELLIFITPKIMDQNIA